ncbi:MAG: arsenate reductase ArsC [Proteobacteria bacterium]|nr:arsenate reductase ArsC [Pseudomonadota bacterium]
MTPRKGILFVCLGNMARSQVAEGIARKLAPPGMEVFSAGLAPTFQVNPIAVEIMAEAGIDISRQYSKTLKEIPMDRVDLVVTLCMNEEGNCPVVPGAVRQLHWPLPDPGWEKTEEEVRAKFREIREELFRRITELFE